MPKKDDAIEMEKMEELSSRVEIIEDPLPDVGDIAGVMPQMSVSVPDMPLMPDDDRKSLIADEELLNMYGDIMSCIKEDREQVSGFVDTMAEMVVNDGDATTSSKEALVNLIKIKTDMTDKMTKIADLMTRVKLKERDTFPKYLAANQNNTININEGGSRRALIEAINKAKKGKEENV